MVRFKVPRVIEAGWQRALILMVVVALVGGTQIAAPSVEAQNTMRATANVYLRSGPGTSYTVVRTIPNGATVTVTGAAQNGFLPMTYNGSSGFASAQYFTTGTTATQPPTGTGPTGTWYVFDGRLNLRAGPGTSYDVIAVLPDGAAVQLTGAVSNGFSQLAWSGYTGWAATQYLTSQPPTAPTATSVPPTPTKPPATVAPTATMVATHVPPTATKPPATVAPTSPPVTPGSTVVGKATVVTGGASLYMRSGPGTTYSVVRSIPNGATVDVMGTAQNGYLPVRYAGSSGWSSQAYLKVVTTTPTATVVPTRTPTVVPTVTPTKMATATPTRTPTVVPTVPGGTVVGTAKVNTGGLSLNLRSGPGTSYGVIRSLPNGAIVDVMGAAQNGFLPVRYQGSSGWASQTYLIVTPVTPTATATATKTPVPTATATKTAVPSTATATATATKTAVPTTTTTVTATATKTATPTPSPTPTPVPGVPIPAGPVVNTGVVTTSGSKLTARTGPGSSYTAVNGIPNGVQVDILGAANNGYLPVRYSGILGWVDARYVMVGATQPPEMPLIDDQADSKGTIGASTALRTGPSTSYLVIMMLSTDWKIEVMGPEVNGWTPVRYFGYKGWVGPNTVIPGWGYVTIDQRITTVSEAITTEPGGGEVVRWVTPGNLIDITGPAVGDFVPVALYRFTGWMNVTRLVPIDQWVDPGPANEHEEAMIAIVYAAADRWGQSRTDMLRVARCESELNPNAINKSSGATGLFQFMPSTFAITPNGKAGQSIYDPWANADAAGWMWANGMKHHWECQ